MLTFYLVRKGTKIDESDNDNSDESDNGLIITSEC